MSVVVHELKHVAQTGDIGGPDKEAVLDAMLKGAYARQYEAMCFYLDSVDEYQGPTPPLPCTIRDAMRRKKDHVGGLAGIHI